LFLSRNMNDSHVELSNVHRLELLLLCSSDDVRQYGSALKQD
jgi:hypothetical protein